ncbi:Polymorphic epithelial mucin (fragment) [Nostocoides japonicum T1-X7]|uniref:Polymorphic epithelial mucin n=1 Tax=Nostocoides japonicum T1-X7 TaxID=1194083 RepID=A0A077M149_9MICO
MSAKTHCSPAPSNDAKPGGHDAVTRGLRREPTASGGEPGRLSLSPDALSGHPGTLSFTRLSLSGEGQCCRVTR